MTGPMTGLASVRRELRHMGKIAVYFARAERQQEIKIGFSTQVRNRLYLLGCQRFTTMTLLGWVPGGPKVEREMHAKFDHLALGREWFTPGPDLLSFIEKSTRHDDPVDIAPKYGRVTDWGYDALVSQERFYRDVAEGRLAHSMTSTLPTINPQPLMVGVPAYSGRAPGRESEHSDSRTTNERLPGS